MVHHRFQWFAWLGNLGSPLNENGEISTDNVGPVISPTKQVHAASIRTHQQKT
jgi:hypothetical protein